ncbi:MAG: M17 family metallopeptidase [Pseudorhodoplanes sp.]
MHPAFAAPNEAANATPIFLVTAESWPAIRDSLSVAARGYAQAAGFEPKAGRHLVLPGDNSANGAGAGGVLLGVAPAGDRKHDPFQAGSLPGSLPAGLYRFANAGDDARLAATGFALGTYRFTRYRKGDGKDVRLVLPEGVDGAELTRIVEGVTLARDLVNTPSNDMGPAELEDAARTLAARHGASIHVVTGDELLAQNFPLIHAVGRASTRAPRLITLTWGDAKHPKVTLVGKGVCFDTGGLDIKPSSAMLLMKKDMGGAATMLALAHMIMDAKLKIALQVLIPAVENAVSGSAFRPGDIYPSRKGLSVEIGNTDAEGRLVLADALARADEDKPELLINMGTLTGAARVALGPDLPPFYTQDDKLADDVAQAARAERDPLWRLPLWPAYEPMLDSKIADLNNAPAGPFAGSITCALFLQRFVSAAKAFLHFDIFAWTPAAKPGRPEGGECQAARALYALLKARYG